MKYKRASDRVKLEARLVKDKKGNKRMEVKEARTKGGNFLCPHCSKMISEGNLEDFPQLVIGPATFHAGHRPIDPD